MNNYCYYNLTHPQKRIWNIDKINLKSSLHNIGGCLNIDDTIDINIMNETINLIIQTNEGLRLRFAEKDSQPVQYVNEFEKENFDFVDFSNYEKPKIEFEKWSEEKIKRNFQLEDNKLYYFAIYKISEKKYGVLLNIHHIISDGWSINIIQKQICNIYSKLIKDESISRNDYNSYVDYIEDESMYLTSKRFIQNKDFWKEKFVCVPEEFLYKTSKSTQGKRKSFNINSELSREIKRFAKDKKCSLNTLFIAILIIYINKTTYKNDLVIGTPVFNRVGKNQKSMIGMFTSTVPFRFVLDTEECIDQLIKSINRELRLCFLNQKYPYDLLIKDLELGKKGYDSLFKMSVNYYNAEYSNEIDGIDVDIKEYYSGSQSYSLQITVKEWEGNHITLNFDYKIREYLAQEIDAMYKYMVNIIKQIILKENHKVKDINLLSEDETYHKIYTLNSTYSCYPSKTVYELFEEQVLKTPDNIALEFNEEKLTYRQLNEKSNQLANYLKENGINKESIIGLMVSHSTELVIAILGILKAGGAYVPIDPSYPNDRINYVLEDSNAIMLLTDFNVNDDIIFNGNIINVKYKGLDLYSKENFAEKNELNELVYIIYTSGSTGKPKGVMVEHKGLTNYLWWAKKMYLKDNEEIMALYSSISFDLTVTSIFTPLISGNKILIYNHDETEFVLYKILRENKATVLKLTPAHLTLLKDMDNSNYSIKRIIVGGEDFKLNLAKEIHNCFRKNISVYNEYGPSETVVGCMIHKYDKKNDKGLSVPIGYPADNVQIYILDSDMNIVPTGVVGELYISGDGVARGYLNKTDLTDTKFIENPFIDGRKMYRTGDTAKYLENGAIVYVGRIDNQIKIRGHRIELGEIEKYILENELIKDATVTCNEDTLRNKSLNAYIVIKSEINDLELKSWLLKFLPRYMVPTNYIRLEQLPLTVNGKVNYALLPNPRPVVKEFVKYKTNVEKELVEIIETVLKVQNISMKDNYYQLGGDSIKAIQISSKLKNIGLSSKVKDILTYDTIEEIAAMVEVSERNKAKDPKKCNGHIKNTPIIEWFFKQRLKNEHYYNQYICLELDKPLGINDVIKAVNKLVENHDALRINYDRNSNQLFYNNGHLNKKCLVKQYDLSKNHCYKQNEDIGIIKESIGIEFDIEKSILFDVSMVYLDSGRQLLLFTAHHLIVDGISWRIILNDFITIIKQLVNNELIELPLKSDSFKEWSEQLYNYRKNDFIEEISYWESILNKNYIYPVDFYEEADNVKTVSVLYDELDEEVTNDLIKRVNEIYSIEFNESLIIALVLTINKITSNEEVIIELERHGRESINNSIDISRTVGWFTSIFPAYFKIENELIENELIDNNIKLIKEQLRNIPNKGFNYGILKFLNHELKDNTHKYVRFNYLGDFDNVISEEALKISNITFGLDSAHENPLTALMDITAMTLNKRLKINITYSSNRFRMKTIQKFIGSYLETLKLIADYCIKKSFKEFTPSDFKSIDISQEELDSLFK